MARFGVFQAGAEQPVRIYEGERIIQYVQIVNDKPGKNVELIATIKLETGQSIRQIE